MIIDSHQHFWYYNPKTHAWINDSMAVIRKDFLPQELEQVYAKNGIDGCIAVQANQTLEETQFLLSLAKTYNFIKGVVGWVDLCHTNLEKVLFEYKKNEKLKGFRHIVQSEPDSNFLLRPDFIRGITYLEKYNFTYDILVFPHQLGAVLELVKRFPNQKFVIDHMAKPYIKDGFFEGWAVLINEIGKCENVFCKLSGIITEADYNTWTKAQIQPYLDHVLSAFGTSRLMFGSDWPVCLVAGTYTQVKQLITHFISKLTQNEQQQIMGGNAVSFYNL